MAQAGPIALPGATHPVEPARPVVGPQPGGIGLADLPARAIVSYPPPPPAYGGEHGPALTSPALSSGGYIGGARRSPAENDVALPEVEAANTLGHNSIAWSRPVFPNVAGVAEYVPPTGGTSWSANATIMASAKPTVPIPWSAKRVDNATVREEYGSTRALFPWPALRARRQSGIALGNAGRRKQAQTTPPYFDRLTVYQAASAYGLSTQVLGMGSYT